MFRKIYNHLVAPKLALTAAAAAAAKFGLKAFEVPGSNMAPTLEPKDIAWYRPITGMTELRRRNVIALQTQEFGDAIIPSRVVALSGETVEIRHGELVVDGAVVAQPYLDPQRAEQDYSLTHQAISVPSGHVWHLGDFRDMSKDSRHLGPIPASAVLGLIKHSHAAGQHAKPKPVA